MKCPYCKADNSKNRHYVVGVVDYGVSVRRTRKCWKCGRNFFTFENYRKEDIKVENAV